MTAITTDCLTGHVPLDVIAERLEVARIAKDIGQRYEVCGYLNKGGFATVWKARDRIADIPVAVKRLNLSSKRSGDFYRELRAMFRIQHSHIVRLINFLEAEGTRYLILELCHGGSLRAAISAARHSGIRCTDTRTAAIVRQIASGLAVAHREGFAHLDIKPENVLFDKESAEAFGGSNAVKLADFGLASLLRQKTEEDGLTSIAGSPAYMAPEQFHGIFGPSSDIYSLGVLAYELLHGVPPFSGGPESLALKHLREAPALSASLPMRWQLLLADMLSKDSSERPSASDVVTALEPVSRGEGNDGSSLDSHRGPIGVQLREPLLSLHSLDQPQRFLAITESGFSILAPDRVEYTIECPGIRAATQFDETVAVVNRMGDVSSWHPSHGLNAIGRAPNEAKLLFRGSQGLTTVSHDGIAVTSGPVSGAASVWMRNVNAGGLKPLLARTTQGHIAAVEFEGVSGLRFLDTEGDDLGWIPLPGICWQLQACGEESFVARLLTGRGFEIYRCNLNGSWPLNGSLGLAHYAADPHSTAVVGLWPDGSLKWWESANREPVNLATRIEPNQFAGIAVNRRTLAWGDGHHRVRWESVEIPQPKPGSHQR